MKNYLALCLLSCIPLFARKQQLACNLDITSTWNDLEDKEAKTEEFGGRWMHAGTFVFKNKSGDNVPLKELDLAWKGKKKISSLVGSLFKKEPNKPFMPIEKMLVSDGHWNKRKQVLQLKFNDRVQIGTTTTFCLVLTVPENLENTLDEGYFTVITDSLPRQLKKSVRKQRPILSISPSAPSKKPKNENKNRLALKS